MKYRIEKYNPSHYNIWNDLVHRSKNGTFLFHRDFMEYHSDRFEDFSLLVFEGEKLQSIFPANKSGNEVFSHQGLTYGGLIMADSLSMEDIKEAFSALTFFFTVNSIDKLTVKQVPFFYHKKNSSETDYILHKAGALLYRRDMNLAIDFSKELNISKSKLKHFRKISKLGLELRQDNEFELFWEKVLVPRLNERHGTNPVHTKEEIRLLHSRFPKNILQYNVYYNEQIIAGLTIFNFGNVMKSQYGATTNAGEGLRALDYIFITLIMEYKDKIAFFDMGTVVENNPDGYNKGLLKQKQELGCSVYLQDFYQLETKNYSILDKVII